MSKILGKTRKELWSKAAGRCSICNKWLFEPAHTCIGEECHIISEAENGPRHQKGIDDYSCYDNLILLCRNHHKEIDDNPSIFTIEKLKHIKKEHEKKINKQLKKEGKSTEIAFKVSSGEALGSMVWGCHSYRTFHESGNPQLLNIEEEISEIIRSMLDLQYDILGEDKRKIYKELDLLIQELKSLNASAYACIANDKIYGVMTNSIILYLSNSCSCDFIVVEHDN